MSHFSELLNIYSKRININAPRIANYCGLDRVTVYRFMKGKSLPKTKETIYRLAEILQLTEMEKEALEGAYDSARLSPRVYWERRYIRSFMRAFSGVSPIIPLLQYDTADLQEPYKDTLIVGRRDCTIKRIQKEILRECEKTEGCTIKIIMRTGIGPVMDMLLSAGKRNKHLQLKHLIPVTKSYISGSDGDASLKSSSSDGFSSEASYGLEQALKRAYIDTDHNHGAAVELNAFDQSYEGRESIWKHELLQNFFKVVSMCAEEFDYRPSFFYSRRLENDQFPVYSNLLLTEKAVILFTDNLEESILFFDPHHVLSFHQKFDRFADGKPALSYVFKDIASFMDNMNRVIINRDRRREDTEYFYASQPCIIPVLTGEVIQNHLLINKGLEEMDVTVGTLKGINQYVNAIRDRFANDDNNQVNFVTEQGIHFFMKTGRFAEVPMEMYTPLSVEERREMLLRLSEHPNFKIRIIKKKLSAPEGMLCIEVMDKALFLEFLIPEKGMCFLYVTEPSVLLAFRNFFSDFPRDDMYSEEESREILKRIAQEYV